MEKSCDEWKKYHKEVISDLLKKTRLLDKLELHKLLTSLPSEDEIFQIIKNSHFISTEGDTTHITRKEREDMLEKDCFGSLAKAISKRIGTNT